MKISTSLTEIKELFAHHLGINVSELELTIESEDVPVTSNEDDDGWIINTQTTEDPPSGLKYYDEIEIVYDDGQQTTLFVDYVVRFHWNTSYGKHIVKYRKVNN
jgi:hypothetical protein